MSFLGPEERQQILNILKQWKENNGLFEYNQMQKPELEQSFMGFYFHPRCPVAETVNWKVVVKKGKIYYDIGYLIDVKA